MALPMRHLLAGSAVAGLLFLLPIGAPANAQDNRNTGGWGAAGVVVLSFIAGGAGGIASGLLLQRSCKGKRGDGTMEAIITQLNSSVKELDTKLNNSSVDKLTSTLENKIGNLKDDLERLISSDNKALNDLEQEVSGNLIRYKNENNSLRESLEEAKRKLKDQDSNKNDQWEIMKDLCNKFYTSDKNSQKTNPIDYLKLIKATKSVECLDCLDAAGRLLPDSLTILPKALRSAEKHRDFKSEKIDQLFERIWKLGTELREKLKKGSRTYEAVSGVFTQEQCALKGGKPVTVEYQGKTVEMHEHLKIDDAGGNGAPKNSCLRIYFHWDNENEKVVIGYCGKHL